MGRRHFPRCNGSASRLLFPSLGICAVEQEPCKLLRARPFSFPSSLTKEPSKARRRGLDICRRLGGPAWSLKRSSDLSSLIDGHKPPGSTPRVGKEVPPRKVPFHMLILAYKYRSGAAEQQRALGRRERAPPERLLPSRTSPHPEHSGCARMTATAATGSTHKLPNTKEERKVGPLHAAVPTRARRRHLHTAQGRWVLGPRALLLGKRKMPIFPLLF